MLSCVTAGRWGDLGGGVVAFSFLAGNVCRHPPSPLVVGMFSFPAAPPTTVFCARHRCACHCRLHSAGACVAPPAPGNPGRNQTGETLTGGGQAGTCFWSCCRFCRCRGCQSFLVLSLSFAGVVHTPRTRGIGRRSCKHADAGGVTGAARGATGWLGRSWRPAPGRSRGTRKTVRSRAGCRRRAPCRRPPPPSSCACPAAPSAPLAWM